MWHILKTELAYNKYTLIAMYAVALGFFVVAMIWDGGVYSLVPNTIVVFWVGMALLGRTICKESRERQHAMLPQSTTQRGVTRMLVFICFQGGMVFLWLITYLLNWSEAPEAIWMMLTANALVLTIKPVGFIHDDTKCNVPSITRTEGWSPAAITHRVSCLLTNLIVVVLLIIAVAGTGEKGFMLVQLNLDWKWELTLREFLRGPSGAFVANLLFLVAFYLSASFSLPRRSFASSR